MHKISLTGVNGARGSSQGAIRHGPVIRQGRSIDYALGRLSAGAVLRSFCVGFHVGFLVFLGTSFVPLPMVGAGRKHLP